MRYIFQAIRSWGGIVLLVMLLVLTACENGLQAEQVAQPPPTQQPTPPATATQGVTSPLPTPTSLQLTTPTVTLEATPSEPLEATPILEVVPTLSGPFPVGPKIVYSENRHDGFVTFWAASPINPAYRLPLATGLDPSDFGVNAALSPNQQMIAYTTLPEGNRNNRLAAELRIVNINDTEERLVASGVDIGGHKYPLWSPDNRYLVFVRASETADIYDTAIWMIEIETGIETPLIQSDVDEYKFVWPLGWSVDSTGIYYRRSGGPESEVHFFSISQNTSNFVISVPSLAVGCILSPDSTQLLCDVLTNRENRQHALVTYFLQEERTSAVVDTKQVQDSDDYFLYLWGPGLEMITVSEKVTGEQDTKLQVVNAQSEIVEKDINLRRSGTYDPRSWSPDGMWLATQSASSPGGDLYFFSEDGQVSTHLPANGAIDVLGWLTIDLPFNAQ